MIDRWATPIWRSPDGTVEALERVSVGQAPVSESDLRDLLAARATALPVRHFDPVFSSPVCVGTEFPVPGVGRVDALFLSPSGYLTIVETKLWQNPEARREVVAQIIDYAQEIARWTFSDLETTFREQRAAAGQSTSSLYDHVCESEDGADGQREFVDAVNRCLRDGRFLLLVIGDGIREGVEKMAEFLQRTPTLQYTLGLVELACYRRRGQHDSLLVVPQIIARTTEITRAVVHIDLQGRDEHSVKVTAVVPPDTPPTGTSRVNRLSEEEFYSQLGVSSSSDAAQRLRAFVEDLMARHESIEVTFTPRWLQMRVQPLDYEGPQLVVLAVSTEGRIRTRKWWVDYLVEHAPEGTLELFIQGLGAVDERIRPLQKSDGIWTVPKGEGKTADLVSVLPKLDDLAAVVATAVRAVETSPRR